MQSAVADSVFLEMGRRDGLYCCSAYLDKHMLDERADEFSNMQNYVSQDGDGKFEEHEGI